MGDGRGARRDRVCEFVLGVEGWRALKRPSGWFETAVGGSVGVGRLGGGKGGGREEKGLMFFSNPFPPKKQQYPRPGSVTSSLKTSFSIVSDIQRYFFE